MEKKVAAYIKITPKKPITKKELDEMKKKLEEEGLEYYIVENIEK